MGPAESREEAATDHQTMEICLTEIERCQKTGITCEVIHQALRDRAKARAPSK